MNSGSDIQSSEDEPKHKNRDKRSRSRSRDRQRDRRYDRPENRDRDRKIRILIPEISAPFLSFKHFCNLQTEKISTESLQKGYEKYKRDWQQRQNQEFLKQYKKDAWFSEKYDPEVLDLLQRDRKENNRRLSTDFLTKLEEGYFDHIDFRIKQPSQLGVVEQVDEQEEPNSKLSFILNQTFDIHMNTLFDITKAPYFGFDQDHCTLFIKAVPRSISRYDIRSVVQKLQGYKYLMMSDPVKKMNLTRYCWIEFDSEQACNRAALTLSGVLIKNEPLTVCKSNTKVKRVKVLKNYPSVRIQSDIDTVTRLIAKLDQQIGIPVHSIAERQYSSLNSKFDTLLLYLRRVHAYDYFTGTMYQNQRILSLKGGCAFLRISDDNTDLQSAHPVFKAIQQRSEDRILKGSEVPDYMSILRDQIESFIRETQKVGKEDIKDIWKCMYCQKKFKTCDFLAKHMIARHEEIKFKKIQVIMEKLYLKDPFKITFGSLGDKSLGKKNSHQAPYRRENYRRRQGYRDYDEPDGEKTAKTTNKPKLVNFLDI